jgi:hypothetical protein
MLNVLVIISAIVGSAFLIAAESKPLPIGSCIADKNMCNLYDKELDPWEHRCFTGSILKIEAIGKRSYRTSCVEKVAFCKEFVYFKDVKSDYFEIECPKL